MIKNKEDLRRYLEEDRKAQFKPVLSGLKARIANFLFPDYNYEYVRCLRYLEYYQNLPWGGGYLAN